MLNDCIDVDPLLMETIAGVDALLCADSTEKRKLLRTDGRSLLGIYSLKLNSNNLKRKPTN